MKSVRKIVLEMTRDVDGSWFVRLAPDVLCRASTREEVIARAQASTLRTLARRIEQGMLPPEDALSLVVEVRETPSRDGARGDAE